LHVAPLRVWQALLRRRVYDRLPLLVNAERTTRVRIATVEG
jgi:hypothetical protein